MRDTKTQLAMEKEWKKYINSGTCPFCEGITNHKILKETDYWFVIENKYPYSTFEGKKVKKHLLLVPKEHLQHWGSLLEEQLHEESIIEINMLPDITIKRITEATSRSVPIHIHTHLIYL